MNFAGESAYPPHTFPVWVPCFLLSSMDNLLAEINAISMPEKELKELEQAAYYNKVGRSRFRRNDLYEVNLKSKN